MDFDGAVSFLARRLPESPSIFISYTSSLNKFLIPLESPVRFSCDEIPHFPTKRGDFPSPQLLYGTISGVNVLVMQGRYHIYEGYNEEEICFPVRVANCLGCKKVLTINAAGSMSNTFDLGDLMLVRSHVDLKGLGEDTAKILREGVKQIEANTKIYAGNFSSEAKRLAIEDGMDKYVKSGVYGMIDDTLPNNYSQIFNWKTIGVDAIGTSLIPEVLLAGELGMEVFAVSVMTDKGILDYNEHPDPLLEDISRAVDSKKPFLKKLILKFVEFD